MSLHPVRIEALPEPHLQGIREYLKLESFLTSNDDTEARWLGYIAATEQSLCKLYKQEPSTPTLRAAIAIGLGLSEDFRKFVVHHGGAEDARNAEAYAQVLSAGAGTMINQCSERRREKGGNVAVS